MLLIFMIVSCAILLLQIHVQYFLWFLEMLLAQFSFLEINGCQLYPFTLCFLMECRNTPWFLRMLCFHMLRFYMFMKVEFTRSGLCENKPVGKQLKIFPGYTVHILIFSVYYFCYFFNGQKSPENNSCKTDINSNNF